MSLNIKTQNGLQRLTDVRVGNKLISKTISANGTYVASNDEADGYSSVTVNVPQPTITTTGAGETLTWDGRTWIPE